MNITFDPTTHRLQLTADRAQDENLLEQIADTLRDYNLKLTAEHGVLRQLELPLAPLKANPLGIRVIEDPTMPAGTWSWRPARTWTR